MPELTSSDAAGGAVAPPWRRFVDQRFPDPQARELLRRALRRTFNVEDQRPARVFVVGPPCHGKSALLHIIARTCRAAAIPASHVGFTHAYGHEPSVGPNGEPQVAAPRRPPFTETTAVPTVLWACCSTDALQGPPYATVRGGREVIYVDLRSDAVECTPSFSQDVSTLDVLTWLAEQPA